MRIAILFVMLCPLFQGCVGGVVLKPHTEVILDPVIASIRNDADPVHKRTSSEATNAPNYTSEWLRIHWDEPSRIHRSSGNSETWTYGFRPIWEGLVPCMIVPIPLVLPLAREQVSFTLRDGRVIDARWKKPWMVGPVAGFMLSPEGGGGFAAASLNEQAPN